jgi:hypothetical protein
MIKLFRHLHLNTNRRRRDDRSIETDPSLDFECKIRPDFVHHSK